MCHFIAFLLPLLIKSLILFNFFSSESCRRSNYIILVLVFQDEVSHVLYQRLLILSSVTFLLKFENYRNWFSSFCSNNARVIIILKAKKFITWYEILENWLLEMWIQLKSFGHSIIVDELQVCNFVIRDSCISFFHTSF